MSFSKKERRLMRAFEQRMLVLEAQLREFCFYGARELGVTIEKAEPPIEQPWTYAEQIANEAWWHDRVARINSAIARRAKEAIDMAGPVPTLENLDTVFAVDWTAVVTPDVTVLKHQVVDSPSDFVDLAEDL